MSTKKWPSLEELKNIPAINFVFNIFSGLWSKMDKFTFSNRTLMKTFLIYPIGLATIIKVLNKIIWQNPHPKFLLIFATPKLFELPFGAMHLVYWYSLLTWWAGWTILAYRALPKEGLVGGKVKPYVFAAFWTGLLCFIITAFSQTY